MTKNKPSTPDDKTPEPDSAPQSATPDHVTPDHVTIDAKPAAPDAADTPRPDSSESGRASIPPAAPRRTQTAWIIGAGAVVLVVALAYVLTTNLPQGTPAPDPTAAINQLQAQLQSVSDRLARDEQRPTPPAPAPIDLQPLEARVAALGQQTDALSKQVTDLANRPAPTLPASPGVSPDDLATLANRVGAVENHVAAVTQNIAAVAQNLQALSDREQARDGQVNAQLQAQQAKLDGTQQLAAQVNTLSDRAGRIAQIQAMQAALDAGKPLGTLPGAPPALARFADHAPPTEAALRQSFPQAAQAALAAAAPDQKGGFVDRMWARAQQTVTVREGDRVLVGNPAAGTLAQARVALEAGDLAGAVADLHRLSGPPSEAMAPWLTQADQLLAARAALAELAGHA
jgi:hypothetical protein